MGTWGVVTVQCLFSSVETGYSIMLSVPYIILEGQRPLAQNSAKLNKFVGIVLPLAMAEGRNDRYPLTLPRQGFLKSYIVD